MLSIGMVFVLSTTAFLVYALITHFEQVRGRRFFLSSFRNHLDVFGERLVLWLVRRLRSVLRHTIKLSWYYSIHSALKTILTVLVRMYDRLELVFINNRERAKRLRAEKKAEQNLGTQNHLTQIEEHKAATALTTQEKKQLKAKKLRGD